MHFAIKHNRSTNHTTAGLFDRATLTYLGELNSEQPIKWNDMTLVAGKYSMYTNGSEMFVFDGS